MSTPTSRFAHNGMRGSLMHTRGQTTSSSMITSAHRGGLAMKKMLVTEASRSEVRSSYKRLRGCPLRTSIQRISSFAGHIRLYSYQLDVLLRLRDSPHNLVSRATLNMAPNGEISLGSTT